MVLSFIATAQAMNRIGVRVVQGEGEFYDTATGDRFFPRGANYVDFKPVDRRFEDRPLATNTFDPDRIAEAFALLGDYGYNTVRVFFDLCNTGSVCITGPGFDGLNPDYLDNMAQFTRIARDHGIHVLFTSNDIPDYGGYGEIANRDASKMIEGYRNAHYITRGGIDAFTAYWRDLMAGLAVRDTAWEAVLGWSLVNEQWTFSRQPPLSLDQGMITNGTGQSYDLSDPMQKRRMITDNLIAISGAVSDIIKATDPDALVTMGFFAPQFPNETGIGGDWYVDTEPLLAGAPLDFFDFHAYTDTDLGIAGQAENFGMPAHRDKPVIMGEVGSSPTYIPRLQMALRAEQIWMAQSCDEGFDGWLHWGFYPFPPGADQHPPYALLSHDRTFLEGLAPVNRPDPCLKGDYEPSVLLTEGATATASRSLPGHPPHHAIDANNETTWESGADAPGHVEIAFAEPGRLGEVNIRLAQYPEGETRSIITAALSDGTNVLLGDLTRNTRDSDVLTVLLPGGLPHVTGLRVEIAASPSWVSFYDIEALRDPGRGSPCLITANGAVNLRRNASTDHPPIGQLPAGTAAMAVGTRGGADGFTWFQLTGDAFVRGDVVVAGSNCAALLADEPASTTE